MIRHLFGLAILFFAVSTTRAQQAVAPAAPIQHFTMQRTWCYGTCPIDSLTLRSDGTAFYRGQRNVKRVGVYTGRFEPDKFALLMDWLGQQNFFAMKAQIGTGNPDTDDLIVSVRREFLPYTVAFRVGGTMDQLLRSKMETAILDATADIEWKKTEPPAAGGLRGNARRPLTAEEAAFYSTINRQDSAWPMRFIPIQVSRYGALNDNIEVWTDKSGGFELSLPPGRYTVHGTDYNLARPIEQLLSRWQAASIDVTVEADKITPVTLLFDQVKPVVRQ